jgi:hypothetical protein
LFQHLSNISIFFWQDATQPKTALQQSHFENISVIESNLVELAMEVKKLCSALSTGNLEKIRLERLLWDERQQAQMIKQALLESTLALGEAVEGCATFSEQVTQPPPPPSLLLLSGSVITKESMLFRCWNLQHCHRQLITNCYWKNLLLWIWKDV